MRVVVLLAAVAAGAGLMPAAATEPANLPPVADPATVAASPTTSSAAAPTQPTTSPPPARSEPAIAKPRPMQPTVVARIDLSAQRLSVRINGEPVHSWAISSGREGYPTPRGVFRPQWAARMWYSRKYDNAPMPHSVFFNGGIAVHATSATGLLGRPASHGCVRLAPAHAAQFYALVHKHGFRNVRIEVIGTPPPSYIAGRRPDRARPREIARHVDRGISVGIPVRQQRSAAVRHPGMIHLPPGHPYKGRDSFELNGIRYVRVR